MKLNIFSKKNKCLSENNSKVSSTLRFELNIKFKILKLIKFDSFHTNRILDQSDFDNSLIQDSTEITILQNEFNTVIQHWIIYMLSKTTKITKKRVFYKNLQIIANLNKFQLDEFHMKLSGNKKSSYF